MTGVQTCALPISTKGGIILTGSAKEKPSVAEVISVGPGGTVDGKTVVMSVKACLLYTS